MAMTFFLRVCSDGYELRQLYGIFMAMALETDFNGHDFSQMLYGKVLVMCFIIFIPLIAVFLVLLYS